MITATRRAKPTIAAPVTPERNGGLRPPDILLPTSVILWAIGVSRTNVTHLGQYGLPAVLPIVFYAGLLMLVASAVVELAQKSPSRIRMALHAVTLVVMLYGTAPLVYQEGRYSWLYKTIGVVQYVNAHGQLNKNIDIYQNWPGFFAFAAWFDKVAGVASPLVYAKWAQLVVELAALPLLYMAYSALSLPARQRWIAILLYSASNWIGQDYFSPQALGTILSLGIIAMALLWMFAGNSSGRRWRRRRWRDNQASWRYRNWDRRNSRLTRPLVVALVLVFFVLTFTHELSPYVVLMQLAAITITGLIRPRWMPVLLGVAIAYFIPRFPFVNERYGLLTSFGSFFSNAAPPSATAGSAGPALPASQILIQHCSLRCRWQYGSLDWLGRGFAAAHAGLSLPWSCWHIRRSWCSLLALTGTKACCAFTCFRCRGLRHWLPRRWPHCRFLPGAEAMSAELPHANPTGSWEVHSERPWRWSLPWFCSFPHFSEMIGRICRPSPKWTR